MGETFARFRLSREGGLPSTGLALSGEVEDYAVDITSLVPWQNGDLPLDVNNDGIIAPLDALLVINELNMRRASDSVSGLLMNPPVAPNDPDSLGYVDVDGNGFATPRDALLVINELNQSAPATAAVAAEAEPDEAGVLLLDSGSDQSTVLIGASLLTSDPSLSADAVDRAIESRSETAQQRVQMLELGEAEQIFGDDAADMADLLGDIVAGTLLGDDDDEDLI